MPPTSPDVVTDWSLETIDAHLPPAPQPVGSYVPAVQTGHLLFTSGTLPMKDGQLTHTGQVGSYTVSVEDAQAAARQCMLNALAVVKHYAGGLDRVARVVKLTGYVSSSATFTEQPAVINAASDVLVALFGDAGKHARAAVGVASLPLDAAVELDLVVELKT